ncbi:hypothetical protein ACU4GD_43950 [Cupriavidus basilensis]
MSARRLLLAACAMALGACALEAGLSPSGRRAAAAVPPRYRRADRGRGQRLVGQALAIRLERAGRRRRCAATTTYALPPRASTTRSAGSRGGSSGLFPQSGLSASATRQRAGTFNGTPFASLERPGNSYQLLANAS